MSKPIILARSPFIVNVDEVDSNGSKIEIYIWNGTGSSPLAPTYTLQKGIVSTTDRETRYDISPYVREYLQANNTKTSYYKTGSYPEISDYDYNMWCNVTVVRYNYTTTYTELDTIEYYALDGYLSSNDDLQSVLDGTDICILRSDSGINYYPEKLVSSYFTLSAGNIIVVNGANYYVRNQTGESITDLNITEDYPRIIYMDIDATVQINLISDDSTVYELKNEVKCLPKYRPIRIDYVNRFGAWQNQWFYGADYETLNIKSDEYQLIQEVYAYPNISVTDYNYKERQTLNKNGSKIYKVNTDWVSEKWNVCLQEIMLSENILLTYFPEITPFNEDLSKTYPVKLNTNSIQLNRHINEKLINYTLEFEYLSPMVNTII